MKKAWLFFLKILCSVLCILGTVFLLKVHPEAPLAINEPTTAEHFEMLEKNAVMLAETLDHNILEDQALTGDICFEAEYLIVTVKSVKAKVTAKIPIAYSEYGMNNGIFRLQGSLELKNAEYERTNELMPAWHYIVVALFLCALLSVCIYEIFNLKWLEWILKITHPSHQK